MIRLFLTDGNFLAREALRTGLGAVSELRVLVRGDLINEYYMARALDLKAHSYLTKTSLLTELAHDLTIMAVGRSYQTGGELLRE